MRKRKNNLSNDFNNLSVYNHRMRLIIIISFLLICLTSCAKPQIPLQDILKYEFPTVSVIKEEENLLLLSYDNTKYKRQDFIPILSDILQKYPYIVADSLWTSDNLGSGIYLRQNNLSYFIYIYKGLSTEVVINQNSSTTSHIEIFWQEGYWE